MKKNVLIIVSVLIAIIAIGGMIYASIKLNEEKKENESHLIELSLPELQEKVKNKETFILVFTQSECGHCANYKPKLQRVLSKHDLYAYEIVLDKLEKEEKSELRTIANTENNGTPTTVFIKDGEEIRISSRLIGDQSESNIEQRLRQLKYIE